MGRSAITAVALCAWVCACRKDEAPRGAAAVATAPAAMPKAPPPVPTSPAPTPLEQNQASAQASDPGKTPVPSQKPLPRQAADLPLAELPAEPAPLREGSGYGGLGLKGIGAAG